MRIKRVYVNHYRCLQSLNFNPQSDALLLWGENGSGKSAFLDVLEIFSKIGCGETHVEELLSKEDFGFCDVSVPVRMEIEIEDSECIFEYKMLFDHPAESKKVRVCEEELHCDGNVVFSRKDGRTEFCGNMKGDLAHFIIDRHLVALPIILESSEESPLSKFKKLLRRIIVIKVVPQLMKGIANGAVEHVDKHGSQFWGWVSNMMIDSPIIYTKIQEFMVRHQDDFKEFRMVRISEDSRRVVVKYCLDGADKGIELPFDALSDGEKTILLFAALYAVNYVQDGIVCILDEPDAYLELSNVKSFVMRMRAAFNRGGQLIVTSHNDDTASCFSRENILIFKRDSHVEPTRIEWFDEICEKANEQTDPGTLLRLGDVYNV